MLQQDTVGRRISYVRAERGLTLGKLAVRAGLSKSFLWEVEHDRSGISGKKLLQVANVLGASVDYLLRGAPVSPEYKPPTVEVPRGLSEVAEDLRLSYRNTMMLLDIERSIVARRGGRPQSRRVKRSGAPYTTPSAPSWRTQSEIRPTRSVSSGTRARGEAAWPSPIREYRACHHSALPQPPSRMGYSSRQSFESQRPDGRLRHVLEYAPRRGAQPARHRSALGRDGIH